jgi:hypothetical protein
MTLIPEVETALMEAIHRHQTNLQAKGDRVSGKAGAFGFSLGRVAGRTRQLIALSVPVLVTFAVVAVVLSVGHTSRQTIAPTARPNSVASRQRLISILGVLRQPQTKAAADFHQTGWPTPPKPGSQIAPDRALVRLATTTPWGTKVFVVPLTPPSNKVERKDLGETVAVWVQGIGWADFNPVDSLQSEGGWGPGQAVTEPNGTKLYRTFALVPDGVTKVAIYPQAKLGRSTDPGPLVSATVHNNVAVFQTHAHGPGPVLGYWYGSDGRIIKRLGFKQPLHITHQQPPRLTRPNRPVWCPTVFHAQTARMSTPNRRVAGSFDVRSLLGQSETKAAIEAQRHGCAWRVVNQGGLFTTDGRPNRVDANVIDGIVTAVGVY